MSSENINSTTAPATEPTFTIDGKDYKRSELSTKTYNSIIVRQDLQATKIKLSLELEKIAILQAHYDNAIANELGIEIKPLPLALSGLFEKEETLYSLNADYDEIINFINLNN